MKKFTSLLIGCSLALAGMAFAQQPEEQTTPGPGKKGAEKTHAAEAKPGAKPEATAKQTGAMKEQGATTEPGGRQGRKGKASEKSATATGAETSPGAGAIHEVLPCAEIIRRVMAEAETIIGKMNAMRGA